MDGKRPAHAVVISQYLNPGAISVHSVIFRHLNCLRGQQNGYFIMFKGMTDYSGWQLQRAW
jgi:hypothetical protein